MACFGKDADIAIATNSLMRNFFVSVGFAISGFVCTRAKLILALVLVCIATVCYVILEVLLRYGVWPPDRLELDDKSPQTETTDEDGDGKYGTKL